MPLAAATVARLHRQAGAERWRVPVDQFGAALDTSVGKAFGETPSSTAELDRYLASLHLDDLALACACAAGDDAAWEHFIREHRPGLYRAADALSPGGGARDLADALYGDLFGVSSRDGERRSLFRYFHGRSSLGTWLRAVLSQRFVDRVRHDRRVDPLPEDESPAAAASPAETPDPDRARFLAWITAALAWAVARLAPRDRLRLGCYYAQRLTLAQIGRLLNEHEGTVSRHLTRTRKDLRTAVEGRLREAHRLDPAAIAECFSVAAGDPGALDVNEVLAAGELRKFGAGERSRS